MQDNLQKHEWVAQYNWDDGLDPIWPIVDDETTEFATALLIYWRLEGPWFEATKCANREAKRLHDAVAERLTNGFYSARNLKYHPIEDYQLSMVQIYLLRQSGLPTDLFEPQYMGSS